MRNYLSATDPLFCEGVPKLSSFKPDNVHEGHGNFIELDGDQPVEVVQHELLSKVFG
jgi:hypothetical protein